MKLRSRFSRRGGRNARLINQACQIETLERRTLLATIAGTVFNDLNDNGTQDAGEAGVADWQVFVDLNNNFVRDSGEARVYTDANGNYILGGFSAGEVDLAQIVKQGWVESDPGPREGLTVTVASSSSALTGQNFAIRQAIIGGRVFQDFNQDGVRQSNEPGIGGVIISAGTNSTLTSGSGIWGAAAGDLADGTYTVSQASVSGYAFTLPVGGTQTGEVEASAPNLNVNFGNVPLRSISGTVVNDANDSGARDAGEPGLAGWTVFVDYNGDTVVDAGEQSDVTAADGTYELTGIVPGSYFVRAVPQAGFKLRPAAVVASPTGTSDATGIDFVPSAKGRVTGFLWYDVDGDGVKDAGEPAQVGWGVYLDTDNDGVKDAGESRVVTDSTGKYLFTNLTPGAFKVRSQIPANWSDQPTNRSSNLYSPNVTAGSVLTAKDFGYVPAASVTGTVFADTDADGIKDAGEVVLANVQVFADANSNGTFDTGERSTLTLADGTYKLWSLPAGSYVIDFTPPGATTSSAGTPANYAVTLVAGQNVTGKNFGVSGSLAGSVAGQVFDDTDGDGTKDAGEAGIANVRIFIDANNNGTYNTGESTVLTDAIGNYTIGSLAAGTQHAAIVLPANYSVTSPTQISNNVTITSNATSTLNFSIKQNPASTGTLAGKVFDDTNTNGTQDGGELGVSSVRIFVDANANGTFDAGELTGLSDGSGNYSIGSVPEGARVLVMVLPSGYQVTSSTQVTNNVTVTSGTTLTTNFSITPIIGTAVIGGLFSEDVNASGTAEFPPDVALPNRQAFIDRNDNGAYDAATDTLATADDTGTFQFTALVAGTYKVYPILTADESISHGSAFYTVTVTTGEVKAGQDWGLIVAASLNGFVWFDADADGLFGVGDSWLVTRGVFADLNSNGTYEAGTDLGTDTDSGGYYHIPGLAAGNYTVYYMTFLGETSNPVSHTVSLAANERRIDLDFRITIS